MTASTQPMPGPPHGGPGTWLNPKLEHHKDMPILDEVLRHYTGGDERDRLSRGIGRIEQLHTTELLHRWLPAPPAIILDVGGGAGRYAIPLAGRGYHVHLIDPVTLHAQQAATDSRANPATRLASTLVADAQALPFTDRAADVVLLLGPLYHLTGRDRRLTALREAYRVLRPGGVLVAAAISRWASTADGFTAGYLADPEFARIVEHDITTGIHRNPTCRPEWFTTAYFHRPEELQNELRDAGFTTDGPVPIEGLGTFAATPDTLLADAEHQQRILDAIRRTENEPALLGASAHLAIMGRKP
jgi:ubiquinone/menaquinone biosynthesis C-methylase UbiE